MSIHLDRFRVEDGIIHDAGLTDMFKSSPLYFSILILIAGCGSKINSDDLELTDGVSSGQHRIFVSSMDYDGNLGGLNGADAKCASLASGAGLLKTYKAILSDTSLDASDRLGLVGPIAMVNSSGNKIVIANTPSDLWNADYAQLLDNVEIDENGSERPSQTPWTGTSATGGGSLNYCGNWLSNSVSDSGDFGSTDSQGPEWTELSNETCDLQNPIYCISID